MPTYAGRDHSDIHALAYYLYQVRRNSYDNVSPYADTIRAQSRIGRDSVRAMLHLWTSPKLYSSLPQKG